MSFQTTNMTAGSGEKITVYVGDKVRVLTKYGERPYFTVTDIDQDALIGKHHRVRYEDMALLEVSRFSRGETLSAIAATVMVGAAVAALSTVGVMPAVAP